MLFNSIDFALFLPIVFLIYWVILGGNRNEQNIFLLVSSYVFYGWWDWRFLSLILFSTFLDYYLGKFIYRATSENHRKLFLFVSLLTNLGLLAFFKYYNFFPRKFYRFICFFWIFTYEFKSLDFFSKFSLFVS